jgi:nucleolin
MENEALPEEDRIKYEAALELKSCLDELEKNPLELNSKDKRSARRKAEALAIQKVKDDTKSECALDAAQLMEWFHNNRARLESAFSHTYNHGKEKGQETKGAADTLDRTKLLAVQRYYSTMSEIEQNQSLNAKDRRSAKRKAEAIALQETNMQKLEDLIDWFQENQHRLEQQTKGKKRKFGMEEDEIDDDILDVTRRKNPYILFVGQIPFSTSSDDIFQHFQRFNSTQMR